MEIYHRRLNKDTLSHGHDVNGSLEKNQQTAFGHYPQSQVTDRTLITALNKAGGKLPKPGHDELWTDYGYYIKGKIKPYMWYIDLVVGGNKYRGVYFISYRPFHTSWYPSSADFSYQDDNGYDIKNVYWFKYEPIIWRVLDVHSGKTFLMANLVLDSQDFHSESIEAIGSVSVSESNYKESHIRSWLNDNFFNTAFSTEEKVRIQATTVDNSAFSTKDYSHQYACANTRDKVFLLSYAEATSAANGLDTNPSRQLAPSAYAKSQGTLTNRPDTHLYWLRSPTLIYNSVCTVYGDGGLTLTDVKCTHIGVVPALWIKSKSTKRIKMAKASAPRD